MAITAVEGEIVIRLFGGVEVRGPVGSTSFGGAKQRAIVARLAIDPGREVGVDQLIDAVWGDAAPPSVRSSLHVHVSQIRRALAGCGLPDIVATGPNGYLLDLPAAAIDTARFERAATETLSHLADGRHEHAASTLFSAISLWSGEPLPGIGAAPFAQPCATILVERRVDLLVASTDAVLAVGRAGELVPELELVATGHPYHEPLWAALARALYATDRQTDALDRLTTLRRAILDDLGLDPTPMIGELERRILVQDPDLAARSTALTPLSVGRAVRSHLPTLRPLIGRDALVTDLEPLIEAPGQITLLGPAGVGKTAIAVSLAHGTASRRRDGATFVDLAPLASGDDVVLAVAAAVSLRPDSVTAARSDLCDLLATRDALLVLDNCEHVRDDIATLLDDLAGAPDLTILATSRIPIESIVERIVPVGPLTIDDAVAMFLDRVSAADPTYEPHDDDQPAILDLVAEVGGLALGIELLAPLVRTMTPTEIATHVRSSSVPAAGRPPGHSRHRSMDEAIERSVDLLSRPARDLFGRLALLRGGTDLTGVRATCDVDGTIGGRDVVEVLRELVDASLVVAERTPAGTWYRMLYPIQVAAGVCAALDVAEAEDLLDRFSDDLISTVRQLSRAVEGSDPVPGVVGIGRRAAGIRQTYTRFHDAGDRTRVQALLSALGPVTLTSSDALPEAADWVMAELPRLADAPLEHRLRIELAALSFGGPSGADYDEIAQASVDRARELGDDAMLVVALALMVDGYTDHDSDRAVEVGREMIERARDAGPALLGLALNFILNPMLRSRRVDEATAMLDLAFSVGTDRLGIYEPHVVYQAGRLAGMRGDHDAADAHYRAAARAALRLGTIDGYSYALFGQAMAAIARGELREAQSFLLTSASFDRVVAPREVFGGLTWAAIVSVDLGDLPTIERCIVELTHTERPMEVCGLHVCHACAALVRDDWAAARCHLLAAMRAIEHIAAIEWSADLVTLWRRTTDPTDEPAVIALADDVRLRRVTPTAAIETAAATAIRT